MPGSADTTNDVSSNTGHVRRAATAITTSRRRVSRTCSESILCRPKHRERRRFYLMTTWAAAWSIQPSHRQPRNRRAAFRP